MNLDTGMQALALTYGLHVELAEVLDGYTIHDDSGHQVGFIARFTSVNETIEWFRQHTVQAA